MRLRKLKSCSQSVLLIYKKGFGAAHSLSFPPYFVITRSASDVVISNHFGTTLEIATVTSFLHNDSLDVTNSRRHHPFSPGKGGPESL